MHPYPANNHGGATAGPPNYSGTALRAAARWLELSRQARAIEKEMAQLRKEILDAVMPRYEEAAARGTETASKVKISTGTLVVHITFQNRYGKLELDPNRTVRLLQGNFDATLNACIVTSKSPNVISKDPYFARVPD